MKILALLAKQRFKINKNKGVRKYSRSWLTKINYLMLHIANILLNSYPYHLPLHRSKRQQKFLRTKLIE